MITDILGGKTVPADAASPAKQGMGRQSADSNGFSDALSNVDRDPPPRGSQDAEGENSPQASTSSDQGVDTSEQVKPKPIIDIRPALLRDIPGEVRRSSRETDGPLADGRSVSGAERRLRDALSAAKAIVREADGAAAAIGRRPEDDEIDPRVDLSVLEADDQKIADVIALLEGKDHTLSGMQPALQRNTVTPDKRSRPADQSATENTPAEPTGRFRLADTGSAEPLSMPSDLDVEGSETRRYRFANAKGEGQSLSMAVEGARSDRPTVEFKSGSGGSAENIAVLDSRRFIGLAPNSNSANLTAMMSGDAEWAAAMHPASALTNAAAHSSTGSVVNMLKLQMNPHDLGMVTATLRLQGEQLNVHLTVETRAAYRQLSEDGGSIVDALRAQGFAVDQVSISIASAADTDTNNRQQSQAGQSGQQSAAEEGRQENAAGRRQDQTRHDADQGVRDGNDLLSDNAPAVSAGNARPGQLYL